MKGSQLAVRGERVGYNAGMVAFATRQNETAKQAILPRADARAGGSKSATVFNWSDDDAHITISGPTTHELHGFYNQGQSEVASVDQSNQQYSILALTDSSGNISERYAYTAYGQPTFLNASATVQTSSAAANRYTYTSREWDAALGLHHFRARWMSGLTGRFLTRDPIGYIAGGNLVSFDIGLQFADPTGNCLAVLTDPPMTFGQWIKPLFGPFAPGYLPPPKSGGRKCPRGHTCGPVTNPYSQERIRCASPPNRITECRTGNQAPAPAAGWPINGCGSSEPGAWPVPELDFTPACNKHDACYYVCGKTQNDCDGKFEDDMNAICRAKLISGDYSLSTYERCLDWAKTYHAAVVKVADFEDGQDKGCLWGPCKYKYCSCRQGRPEGWEPEPQK